MKIVYTEKTYKELAEGEHFWTNPEDCGYDDIEKIKTESGWDWMDGKSCIVNPLNPDRTVWVETKYREWPDCLIPMSCAAIVILTIAFFCYAVTKG